MSELSIIKIKPEDARSIHLVVLFDFTTILWLRFNFAGNHFEILTKHVSEKELEGVFIIKKLMLLNIFIRFSKKSVRDSSIKRSTLSIRRSFFVRINQI